MRWPRFARVTAGVVSCCRGEICIQVAEVNMKQLLGIAILSAAVALGTAAWAQSDTSTTTPNTGVKQDLKTAGRATSNAAKKAGHKTASVTRRGVRKSESATRSGARKTKRASKRVVHKGARKTRRTSTKVERKTTTQPQ